MREIGWRWRVSVLPVAVLGLCSCGSSDATSSTTVGVSTTAATANTATSDPISDSETTSAATSAATTVESSAAAATTPSATIIATASLVLSGGVSDTLAQVETTSGKCRTVASATTGAALFEGSTGRYILQIQSFPNGTTSFPTTGTEAIVLTKADDATQQWVISTKQSTTAGTATLDGTTGTVDVDMLPDPPNAALNPIHVTGSFSC